MRILDSIVLAEACIFSQPALDVPVHRIGEDAPTVVVTVRRSLQHQIPVHTPGNSHSVQYLFLIVPSNDRPYASYAQIEQLHSAADDGSSKPSIYRTVEAVELPRGCISISAVAPLIGRGR
ncbi:MAG TPA: hypothetical protein VJR89_19915, partial [Polyangiales bacterium]|nr:hypothetical protein [Polyangiales bacterium]